MLSKVPSVMVSSTFYDLRQIRCDLTGFIADELGYAPLLSELNSFPVDPDASTSENCRRRVEEDADVLILVVGGRYGSVDSDTAKSISNLEYLAARSKGIPIYGFIEKKVLALVPVWRQNKGADFAGIVDDTRVFDFIDQIRSVDRVWCHEFETASEIIDTLRVQFAYLMGEGLSWRMQLRERSRETKVLERLRGEALRIALERPKAWEYRLFGRVLADEVELCFDLKRDYELGVVLGLGEHLPVQGFHAWVTTRLSEVDRISAAMSKLTNEALRDAFGPAGTPGDLESIVFVARHIAETYRQALEWAQRVRRAAADQTLSRVVAELAGFADDIISQLEAFGPRILAGIDEALAQPAGAQARVVEVTLEPRIPNLERFKQALETTLHELGLR
jgi:hypothetical protein